MQLSTSVRAAMADAIETTVSTSPKLIGYTGPAPANPAAAATGTVLFTMPLPSNWLTNPNDGTKLINGTWQDPTAANAGIVGYFRIWDNTITTCHVQGSVSVVGGGGELEIDAASSAGAPTIFSGQVVNAITCTFTVGNS